jgi:hypothetical protein
MASNILCGQSGLLRLPSVRNASTTTGKKKVNNTSTNTKNDDDGDGKMTTMVSLTNAKTNRYLTVDRKQLKSDPSAGMEVCKISKVCTCLVVLIESTLRTTYIQLSLFSILY